MSANVLSRNQSYGGAGRSTSFNKYGRLNHNISSIKRKLHLINNEYRK